MAKAKPSETRYTFTADEINRLGLELSFLDGLAEMAIARADDCDNAMQTLLAVLREKIEVVDQIIIRRGDTPPAA